MNREVLVILQKLRGNATPRSPFFYALDLAIVEGLCLGASSRAQTLAYYHNAVLDADYPIAESAA